MARNIGSSYVIDELVGRGATGEVWKGQRLADGVPVAVKVLRPELGDDPEVVARFVQERSVLVGLDSPHLVRVRDLVVEGETLAIVMDLVDGVDLRKTLRRDGRLEPIVAVGLGGQVLDGLSVVHAGGVVHRDLKPENVLIDPTGDGPRALITDFGVARLTHGPSLTRMTGIIGTPLYMAPELANGGDPTPAADVYSAGVVLYELLAGRPPFDASHPVAILRAHLEDPVPPIAGLPEPVWSLLAAMLAKQPTDRPTAADAASRLAAAAGSVAGLAPLQPVAPADRFATAYATGETEIGSRRSNPTRELLENDEPAERRNPLVAAWASTRTKVVVGVVAAGLLIGLGLALTRGDDGSIKVADASARSTRTTTTTSTTTSTTSTTTSTAAPTTTAAPVTAAPAPAPAGGGSSGGGSSGGSRSGGGGAPVVAAPTPPPRISVPNVVGADLNTASVRLKEAGITSIPYVYGCHGSSNIGGVVSQSPGGGASVAPGTAVSLRLQAKDCGVIPNVVGQQLSSAAAAVNGAGFHNIPYVYGCYGSPNVGAVVSQSPGGGTNTSTSTAVNLRLQANNC